MLDREKQPHCDFFTNLSPEVEEELDFAEEEPFDLSLYDQYFEWDEVEYMRLRFIAARRYASRGHWDDAYAYVMRSRPDNIPQHEDVYNRNAQAWHYTNARINELIQEAEQALENRDRELAHGPQFGPSKDSLMPLGCPTESPSPIRSDREEGQGLGRLAAAGPTRGSERPEGEVTPRSPLSPDKKTQKEERDSVVDAVKQITGAKKETPVREGASVGGTAKYDWDTRYDSISGFPSHLRNRVSEPSTPQRGQSPGGDLKHPLNNKDIINSLKYMMIPQWVDLCPPYNRLDKLIYTKSLRKRVLKHHVTFVVTLGMTIEIALRKHI